MKAKCNCIGLTREWKSLGRRTAPPAPPETELRVGTSHQLRKLLKRRQLQERAGHRGQENDKIGAHAGWKMREKSYAQVD